MSGHFASRRPPGSPASDVQDVHGELGVADVDQHLEVLVWPKWRRKLLHASDSATCASWMQSGATPGMLNASAMAVPGEGHAGCFRGQHHDDLDAHRSDPSPWLAPGCGSWHWASRRRDRRIRVRSESRHRRSSGRDASYSRVVPLGRLVNPVRTRNFANPGDPARPASVGDPRPGVLAPGLPPRCRRGCGLGRLGLDRDHADGGDGEQQGRDERQNLAKRTGESGGAGVQDWPFVSVERARAVTPLGRLPGHLPRVTPAGIRPVAACRPVPPHRGGWSGTGGLSDLPSRIAETMEGDTRRPTGSVTCFRACRLLRSPATRLVLRD